jgi:tRNA(adenine34) deaminase
MENKGEIGKNMRLALREAEKAAAVREMPIGAVIAGADGRIIARAHNTVEAKHNATNHAELLCIAKAMRKTGEKYLMGASIFVTLEPCPMCAAAISLAKIGHVYFGAYDEKGGGVANGARVYETQRNLFKPKVEGGIMAEECGAILTGFFKEIRNEGKRKK